MTVPQQRAEHNKFSSSYHVNEKFCIGSNGSNGVKDRTVNNQARFWTLRQQRHQLHHCALDHFNTWGSEQKGQSDSMLTFHGIKHSKHREKQKYKLAFV